MTSLRFSSFCIVLMLSITAVALAQQVRTDFDKRVDFAQYKTYSWKKVTSVMRYGNHG